MAGKGKRFNFHGMFRLKAEAVDREEDRPGAFIREVVVSKGRLKGQRRYLVLSEKKR